MTRDWMVTSIVASWDRAGIIRRAQQGDVVAIQILAAAAPQEAPGWLARRERSRLVLDLAVRLRRADPGTNRNRVAIVIWVALQRAAGAGTVGKPRVLDRFDISERREIMALAAEILNWCPSGKPLSKKSIAVIVAEMAMEFATVATPNSGSQHSRVA